MAVAMRDLSSAKEQRVRAEAALPTGDRGIPAGEREAIAAALPHALFGAMLGVYAQGLALLGQASTAYGYGLQLAEVARIWRGGCIIRAAVLERIRAAYRRAPDLPNLLLDPEFGAAALAARPALLQVGFAAARAGLPTPALLASLSYFDAYRSGWLPANLIQAQRDFFGAHTYERLDAEGVFHTNWEEG
jgi:6-phosphogluconate dehydrogenase